MTSRHVLAAILATGLVLRLLGVGYGLPFPLVSDEEILIGGSLRMMELKTLLPVLRGDAMNILYYPPALSYLYLICMTPVIIWLFIAGGFPSLDQLGLHLLNNIELVWLSARLTSVAFGTATLYLTYRIAHSITQSRTVGVAAAALLCADFMHVMLSHVARHWSATVFIIWLLAWLSIQYFRNPSVKLAIIVGVCSGIGFGTSYIAVLGFGFWVIAHLAGWRSGHVQLASKAAMGAVLTCIASSGLFVAAHPYPFFRLLQGSVVPIYKEKTLAGWLEMCSFYLNALWQSNPTLVIAAVTGVAALALTKRWVFLLGAMAAIMAYTLFLYKALPLEDRYILPLSPLLAILGGYAFDTLRRASDRFPLAKVLVPAGAAIAILASISLSAWSSILLQREDTRTQAKRWIEENIPKNVPVLVNMNTVRLIPDQASLSTQKSLDPNSLKAVDRLRLSDRVVDDTRDLRATLNLWQLSPEGLGAVNSRSRADSLIAQGYSYYAFDNFGANQLPEFHSEMLARMDKIAEFRPCSGSTVPPMLRTTILVPYPLQQLFECERFGPAVTIVHLVNPTAKSYD